jgi:apolipoprotein N-acyltransferase
MLLSLLSPVLLILAFPNFNLNYLAFIGFVPLFFVIKKSPPKKAFLISFIAGFLFYAGALYWLYHVTVAGLIVLCLYLALYFGIFGVIFLLCPVRYALFVTPLAWIFLEYIQSHLFGGFGWALMGYSQYKNLPLIQISDFSGVYGVSFLIIMINFSVYRAMKKSFREIIISAIILTMVLSYGFLRLNEKNKEETIKVSVIQGNIPQEEKWDPENAEYILDRYTSLTKAASEDSPDLIVWPETSFPGFIFIDRMLTDEVIGLVDEINTPLLLGANTEEGLKSFNSAVLLSPGKDFSDQYDKIHLVPFGEYVPFSDSFPILHRLVLGEFGEFTAGKEFKVFNLTDEGRKMRIDFAALICFEDIFPELAREFVKRGAQFLVVITNDAWYGRSGAPYQHAACSVFRAIENRVPVVRCANTGYSCFIDSKGRIYDAVEENKTNLFITGHKTSDIILR